MRGWESFLKIQQINPEARVLLASGYLDANQKSEILNSGIKGFLQKPYRLQDVLKAVRDELDT
jgi:DNA-binding NtrC family response regulator